MGKIKLLLILSALGYIAYEYFEATGDGGDNPVEVIFYCVLLLAIVVYGMFIKGS